VADNTDPVDHDMAEGIAAGKEEDTTAADSVDTEASSEPWAGHSTAGSHDADPCEAVRMGRCAAFAVGAVAFAARAGHRSDSCCDGRQEPT